jgi:hypothetical protein
MNESVKKRIIFNIPINHFMTINNMIDEVIENYVDTCIISTYF